MHTGEVSHIATVQLYGWIYNEDDTDKVTRSRGFAKFEDAIRWTEKIVGEAHAEPPITKLDDYEGALVMSEGGPTWGYVVNVAMFR